MKNRSTPKANRTAKIAVFRRTSAFSVAVAARKIGKVPIGSMTTNRVTKSLMRSCSMNPHESFALKFRDSRGLRKAFGAEVTTEFRAGAGVPVRLWSAARTRLNAGGHLAPASFAIRRARRYPAHRHALLQRG